MLSFRCDCCGKKIPNVVDVVQIRLIPYAYVPEAEPEFKEPLIGELCKECSEEFEDFFLARQEVLAKGRGDIGACPGDLLPKGQTEPETLPTNPYGEGRCITIARIRAEMKQWELGEKAIAEQASVSQWERGKVKPDWKLLEQILPELAEIRKKGCAAYCGHASVCIKRGECYYARYRVKGEEVCGGEDL